MMTGRKQTPSNIKELRGNPGRRPMNEREPRPDIVMPSKPSTLDKVASAKWDELAPVLLRLGVLSEIDGMALESLCMTYSDMVEARKVLMAEGTVLEATETGYSAQRPEVAIYQKARDSIRQWLSEFGLTPASRTRIQVGVVDDGSVEEFQFGKGA